MKRTAVLGIFLGLMASPASAACQNGNNFPIEKSATIVRDVNGFELGMSYAEISKISKLEYLGGHTYETVHGGINYVFGLTELGRIFRIESSQNLGSFDPDEEFYNAVALRLMTKYGKTTRGLTASAPLGWGIVEKVSNTVSGIRNFATNHAGASVTPTTEGVVLNIFMLDHRIVWQDQYKLNCEPTRKGEAKVKF
jgi:hypothetical protein